jgi:hypothetical protein
MLLRKSLAFVLAGLLFTATGCCLDVNGDGVVAEEDLIALFCDCGTPDDGAGDGTGDGGSDSGGTDNGGTENEVPGNDGTDPSMPPI